MDGLEHYKPTDKRLCLPPHDCTHKCDEQQKKLAGCRQSTSYKKGSFILEGYIQVDTARFILLDDFYHLKSICDGKFSPTLKQVEFGGKELNILPSCINSTYKEIKLEDKKDTTVVLGCWPKELQIQQLHIYTRSHIVTNPSSHNIQQSRITEDKDILAMHSCL